MRYHKAHLTRRLILDISADSEIEENMVEWLRVGANGEHLLSIFPSIPSMKLTLLCLLNVFISETSGAVSFSFIITSITDRTS